MGTFKGSANVLSAGVGDVSLWLDQACTQPINDLTEIDFGSVMANGGGFSKMPKIWIRNDANYPVSIKISTNNPQILAQFVAGQLFDPTWIDPVTNQVVGKAYNYFSIPVGVPVSTVVQTSCSGAPASNPVTFNVTIVKDKYLIS